MGFLACQFPRFLPPDLDVRLYLEWLRPIHLDMDHRTVRIHPNSRFNLGFRVASTNQDFAVSKSKLLSKRQSFLEWIRREVHTSASELQQPCLFVPSVGFAEVEEKIAVLLSPEV